MMVEVTDTQKAPYVGLLMDKIEKVEANGAPFSEFINITPAFAAVLLSKNTSNRNIKPTKLDQLKSDMLAGRFVTNGETIIVSSTGELNDGQHRLRAILETGKPQTINMVFGVERESRATVDIGAARTSADILNLTNNTGYNGTIAAAAKRVMAYDSVGGFYTNGRVSNPAVLEFIAENPKIAETAQWAHLSGAKFRALNVAASDIAAIKFIMQRIAPKQAHVYLESLRDGVFLAGDSPIHIVRGALATRPRLTPANKFELIVRGWNYWVKDKTVASTFPVMGKIPDILAPRGKVDEPSS